MEEFSIPNTSKLRDFLQEFYLLEEVIKDLEAYTKPLPLLGSWMYLRSTFELEEEFMKVPWVISHLIREILMSLPQLMHRETPFIAKKSLRRALSKNSVNILQRKFPNIKFSDNKNFQWEGPLNDTEELKKISPRQDWLAMVYEMDYEFKNQKASMANQRFEAFLDKNFPKFHDNESSKSKILDIFATLRPYFSKMAHTYYGSYNNFKEDEFLSNLKEFFNLIAEFTPGMTPLSARNYIDHLIKEYEKQHSIIEKALKAVEQSISTKIYFYNNISGKWLDGLLETGVFDNLPNLSHQAGEPYFNLWPEGGYLLRISSKRAKDVNSVLLSLKTDKTDNTDVFRIYIEILLNIIDKLDKSIIDQHINKIVNERWLNKEYLNLLPIKIQDLLDYLIVQGRIDLVSLVSSEILHFKKVSQKKKHSDEIHTIVVSPYTTYDFYNFTNSLSHIKSSDSAVIKFLRILLEALIAVQKLNKEASNEDSEQLEDNSYTWRPSIETPEDEKDGYSEDMPSLLINSIKDIIKNNIDHLSKKEIESIFDGLPEYSLIIRLRYFTYTLRFNDFKEEIEHFIIKYFNQNEVWYEYQQALKKYFPLFEKKVRDFYIDSIKGLPLIITQTSDKPHANLYRQARLIGPIREYLKEQQKEDFKDVLEYKLPMPSDRFFIMKDYSVQDRSPLKLDEISIKEFKDLLDYLLEFKEENENLYERKTYEGLASVLKSDVKARTQSYLDNLHLFMNTELKPIYLEALFSGLEEFIPRSEGINWELIFDLSDYYAEIFEKNSLPKEKEISKGKQELERGWEDVFIKLLSLLKALILNDSLSHVNSKARVLSFIKTILNGYDNYNFRDSNYGVGIYPLTVKDIKGEALHLLFIYMIKMGKDKLFKKEIIKLLEERIKVDRSLVSFSVYGQYLPWICTESKKTFEKIRDLILPLDNPSIRYVAWERYLSNSIYKNVFIALRRHYHKAIGEIDKMTSHDSSVELGEALCQHILTAHLYEIEGHSELFEYLAENINDELEEYVVDFVGRAYIDSQRVHKLPKDSALKGYWEFMLKNYKNPSSLVMFGRWVEEDRFENDWMLNKLIETLEITGGEIEPSFYVLETLSNLTKLYPNECIKALKLIVKSDKNKNKKYLLQEKPIRKILKLAYNSGEGDILEKIQEIINDLLDLGLEEYREVITNSN